jgi:2-polyprenyl-6-methoxyphenol hydroxylase-like FAD-dependent oxidoreductase
VCVAGGGPAGLMLGLLLARQGIETVVLEKHADFLRDFRGDTVHSSTLNILDEIGLTDVVAKLPGREAARLRMTFEDGTYPVADFTRLPSPHNYLYFVPQWDFLDLLAAEASTYPSFKLMRSAAVASVRRDEDGTVTGVTTESGDEIAARLTVACDGRFSTVRESLGLVPREFGAPMDVLWFRLPRRDTDGEGLDFTFGYGGLMICIDRGDYYQCAFVIAKGGYETVVEQGLPALRARIARLAPFLADRVDHVAAWDDVKLLTVKVNRLERWYGPGYLLIGDAAHAMSPIGGVGINLAIQDAVATARLLGPSLKAGGELDLASVQKRRSLPTAVTQRVQRLIQSRFVDPLLHRDGPVHSPAPLRLLRKFPALQRIPARLVGYGARPEHVKYSRSSR